MTYFDAQLQILDLLEHKAIFTAGYKAILHLHSLVEECEITRLLAQIDIKTKEKKKARVLDWPCLERALVLQWTLPANPSCAAIGPLPSSHLLGIVLTGWGLLDSKWLAEPTRMSALELSASCRCDASMYLTAVLLLLLQVKFVKSGTVVIVRIEVEKQICAELFDQVPQLGRFTLRDEGRTIAIGKIIKLPKSLKEGAPEAK